MSWVTVDTVLLEKVESGLSNLTHPRNEDLISSVHSHRERNYKDVNYLLHC